MPSPEALRQYRLHYLTTHLAPRQLLSAAWHFRTKPRHKGTITRPGVHCTTCGRMWRSNLD